MKKINFVLIKISTLGRVGDLPASGTFGSLCAVLTVPFFLKLSFITKSLLLIFLVILGIKICSLAEINFGSKDPKEVVFDEFVGQLLVFLPFCSLKWIEIFIGFLLFRLFDIFKPWPVRYCDEKLPAGLGIMADDVVSGIFALILLTFFHRFISF